jgi:hypothetical protein
VFVIGIPKPLKTVDAPIFVQALIDVQYDASEDAHWIRYYAFDAKTCEHGMRYNNCYGPNHYPPDDYF